MKVVLKYIALPLIFAGIFLSCFQLTLIHAFKIVSDSNISLLVEDDTEEDFEFKKSEIEDDYVCSTFDHTFYKVENLKAILLIKELNKELSPVFPINIQPPKI